MYYFTQNAQNTQNMLFATVVAFSDFKKRLRFYSKQESSRFHKIQRILRAKI